MQKSRKIISVIAVLFSLLLFICSNSIFQVLAFDSAERNVKVDEAWIIEPGKDETGIDVSKKHESGEIYFLDIYIDGIDVEETPDFVEDEFIRIKENHQKEVIEKDNTFAYYDGKSDAKDIVKIYNDTFRKDQEKYTVKDFELDKILDVEVSQNILDKLDQNPECYVRAILNLGAGQKNDDPLPIILYRCDDNEEWNHFYYEPTVIDGVYQNWAERREDGTINLYFYRFCPIMLYEPVTKELPSCSCRFNWWWIILIILFALLMFALYLFFTRDKDDNDDKKEPVTEEGADSASSGNSNNS